MNTSQKCPKCHEGALRSWDELIDEEREVVKRLPGSADYDEADRKARHRWCTRCWHETTVGETNA